MRITSPPMVCARDNLSEFVKLFQFGVLTITSCLTEKKKCTSWEGRKLVDRECNDKYGVFDSQHFYCNKCTEVGD